MNIHPIGDGKEFKVPDQKLGELEPQDLGVGSDPNSIPKTAERFQLEDVPKYLKNTAKIFMKVVSAPPAFLLEQGGRIVQNLGFFIRATPMALGRAIGEGIGRQFLEKNELERAGLVGAWTAFIVFSPITVPATAVELLGQLAHFAGHLHIKANIKEKIDLGVYLKHHFIGKSPAAIKQEYANEQLKKNPSITKYEINQKIAHKFRNQKDLRNLKTLYTDQEIIEELMLKLKPKVLKVHKDSYVSKAEKIARNHCESLKIPEELTKKIIKGVKEDAVLDRLDDYVKRNIPNSKAGSALAFLKKPESKILLHNPDKLEQHLSNLALSEDDIETIFKLLL